MLAPWLLNVVIWEDATLCCAAFGRISKAANFLSAIVGTLACSGGLPLTVLSFASFFVLGSGDFFCCSFLASM
jgi:hypothetical protein